MIRNISISAFINIIFVLAIIAIALTFSIFIKLDQQRYNINMQKKYELVAGNLLKSLDSNPTKSQIDIILKQFKMQKLEDDEVKLEIVNSAIPIIMRNTPLGVYRIFNLKGVLYTYVQKDGYNLMILDTESYSYNLLIISIAIALSLIILISLYYIIKKKLKPLRNLNKEIKRFSRKWMLISAMALPIILIIFVWGYLK